MPPRSPFTSLRAKPDNLEIAFGRPHLPDSARPRIDPEPAPVHPLCRLALVAVLAVSAGAALPATAGQADRDSALRWFDGMDTDHDQVITPDEMLRVREKRFGRYDGDGDGYVTLDEFNFAVPKEQEDEIERRSRRFDVMDEDNDDRLTKEEYLGFGDRVIHEADQDGDGSITRDEFADTVAPQ